jgi:hypothetical protein
MNKEVVRFDRMTWVPLGQLPISAIILLLSGKQTPRNRFFAGTLFCHTKKATNMTPVDESSMEKDTRVKP